MDAETNVIRKECRTDIHFTWEGTSPYVRMWSRLQSTALSVRGATSVPASNLISSSVFQKPSPIAIYGASRISQGRMTGIEILNVNHATDGGSCERSWTHPARRCVYTLHKRMVPPPTVTLRKWKVVLSSTDSWRRRCWMVA